MTGLTDNFARPSVVTELCGQLSRIYSVVMELFHPLSRSRRAIEFGSAQREKYIITYIDRVIAREIAEEIGRDIERERESEKGEMHVYVLSLR